MAPGIVGTPIPWPSSNKAGIRICRRNAAGAGLPHWLPYMQKFIFGRTHSTLCQQLMRIGVARLTALLLILALIAGLAPAAPQDGEISPSRAKELFAQIDQMLASLGEIMGLKVLKPIERSLLTRDEINQLVAKRIREEIKQDEVRLDELFLKKFGLVDNDFDLVQQLTDVLTEQATALYDFKTRTMFLATWTPEDMQEFALVHELAHALADQHFNLAKFVKQAKGADEDLARSAVLEGQASWLMTEYVLRPAGRSMVDSPLAAKAAAAASRVESREYPVYSNAPLYVKESLLFPYTAGLLFQQAVVEKYGVDGFSMVFERPPISSQQILHPEAYFEGRRPANPALPKPGRIRGFKKVAEGQTGELDHWILLKQFFDEKHADALSPAWRGGRYELLENKAKDHVVLLYASEWENESRAAEFFKDYLEVCKHKWSSVEIENGSAQEVAGRSAEGGFVIRLQGKLVSSVEGLPR
jgi:hypothetical protein